MSRKITENIFFSRLFVELDVDTKERRHALVENCNRNRAQWDQSGDDSRVGLMVSALMRESLLIPSEYEKRKNRRNAASMAITASPSPAF